MGEHKSFFSNLYSKAIHKQRRTQARRARRAAYKTRYTRTKANGMSAFFSKASAFFGKSRRILCGGERKTKDEMGEIYEQT